jgi:2-C-methyl-D-erythritol 4-phosphate cytidylyltransferase
MHCLLLLAGGSGFRMQGSVSDKTLAPLKGKAVIAHALDAFAQSGKIQHYCVVCRDNNQRLALEAALAPLSANIQFIQGGDTRQQSVYNGLQALPPETSFVYIHDGARPLISLEAIDQLHCAVQNDDAAVLAHPVTDTVKRVQVKDHITRTNFEDLDRNRLWAMETPQAFRYKLILEAYQLAQDKRLVLTDDTAAISALGHHITIVSNPLPNPKITTREDLNYLEWLLGQ